MDALDFSCFIEEREEGECFVLKIKNKTLNSSRHNSFITEIGESIIACSAYNLLCLDLSEIGTIQSMTFGSIINMVTHAKKHSKECILRLSPNSKEIATMANLEQYARIETP